MNRVACLSGRDIAALLSGEKISAYGVEFVFDGADVEEVEKSLAHIRPKRTHKQRRAKDVVSLDKN